MPARSSIVQLLHETCTPNAVIVLVSQPWNAPTAAMEGVVEHEPRDHSGVSGVSDVSPFLIIIDGPTATSVRWMQ
nr:hypothetical protein CFP56_78164 [Quercus suber]